MLLAHAHLVQRNSRDEKLALATFRCQTIARFDTKTIADGLKVARWCCMRWRELREVELLKHEDEVTNLNHALHFAFETRAVVDDVVVRVTDPRLPTKNTNK